MAYYLDFSQSSDVVTFNRFTLLGDYSISIKFKTPQNPNENSIFLGDSSYRSVMGVYSGGLRFRPASTQSDAIPLPAGNTEYVANVSRVGSLVTITVDGVGSVSMISSENPAFACFGRYIVSSSTYNFSGGLYSAEFFSDGTLIHQYNKQTLNGTNDTVLPDTVGGNDGTLVGFPTDNSQWVFYDDGGAVTADAAYSVNAPTFTGSASVTLPEPTADASFTLAAPTFTASADASLPQPIANGSFSITSPTFSANANASLPRPIADAAFTLNAPTFSASATATIPSFNASIAYSVNAPTFTVDATVTLPNPTAAVAYTVNAPAFSVDSVATLPQPTANAAFSLPSPAFSASATATEPDFNASVNFTLPSPTFSAEATSTLPQPNADVGFTVSAPTFSVVAIVGGIAIIVDEETNINQRVMSNNINAPILSNNING